MSRKVKHRKRRQKGKISRKNQRLLKIIEKMKNIDDTEENKQLLEEIFKDFKQYRFKM